MAVENIPLTVDGGASHERAISRCTSERPVDGCRWRKVNRDILLLRLSF